MWLLISTNQNFITRQTWKHLHCCGDTSWVRVKNTNLMLDFSMLLNVHIQVHVYTCVHVYVITEVYIFVGGEFKADSVAWLPCVSRWSYGGICWVENASTIQQPQYHKLYSPHPSTCLSLWCLTYATSIFATSCTCIYTCMYYTYVCTCTHVHMHVAKLKKTCTCMCNGHRHVHVHCTCSMASSTTMATANTSTAGTAPFTLKGHLPYFF